MRVNIKKLPGKYRIIIKKVICTISIIFFLILLFSYFPSPVFSFPSLAPFKKAKNKRNEKIVCNLAKSAVEKKLRKGKVLNPPGGLPAFLERPAGVFVTILRNNKVVGCMGTIYPRESNLKSEIIRSAILAANVDPWHKSIRKSDLPRLKYVVSIPGNARKIDSTADLDPKNLGLLVRRGKRSALLLPGEALTPEWQIYECKRKAGILQNERVEMIVFETVTFGPIQEKK
ncbi:MAG: AMMECR1 domain-containing protein [Candidatus Eremiobacteraeota bacterium]|nr:AMMECR1 domain-containing protein [Candidatus Eremiobacteraeota bacterium]